MRTASLALFASLSLPALGSAQVISQGATHYDWAAFPTTCGSATGLNDFTANAQDTLYQHFWAFCIDNDISACNPFGGTLSAPASGFANVGVLRFPNFGGRSIDVEHSVAVTSLGINGIAVSRFRIKNNSAAPMRLNLYAYSDFDMYGTQNSATGNAVPAGRFHSLSNATAPGDFVEFFGFGADGDAVATYAGLRGQILSSCPDYTLLPFSPGGNFGPADYTGAFQWKDRMIAPGATFDTWIGMGHNVSVRTCASASAVAYGSSSGSPNGFLAGTAPVLGSILGYEVRGAASGANQPGAILFGLTSFSLPVGGLVLLNSADLFTLSVTLDASSTARGVLPVPYLPPICGATLHGQAFYIDPASPAGVPLSATNGVTYVAGS